MGYSTSYSHLVKNTHPMLYQG